MQKRWVFAIVTATLILGLSVGATAASLRKSIEVDYSSVKIKVDGKIVDTGNSHPFIVVEEGRTYVPARYLAEALKAKVGFDDATNTVLVYTPDYYESKIADNEITYRFPYYGTSMTWPSEGQKSPDSGYLVQHQSPDVTFQLARMPFPRSYMTFDQQVTSIVAGMEAIYPVAVTRQTYIPVAGARAAKELHGVVQANGQEMLARMRFILHRDELWFIVVIWVPGRAMDDATVTRYLDTFTLGQ